MSIAKADTVVRVAQQRHRNNNATNEEERAYLKLAKVVSNKGRNRGSLTIALSTTFTGSREMTGSGVRGSAATYRSGTRKLCTLGHGRPLSKSKADRILKALFRLVFLPFCGDCVCGSLWRRNGRTLPRASASTRYKH